jgi:hypothetical protein
MPASTSLPFTICFAAEFVSRKRQRSMSPRGLRSRLEFGICEVNSGYAIELPIGSKCSPSSTRSSGYCMGLSDGP